MTAYSVLGTRVTREDGPDKVSGRHLYSADVILPGMVWGKVLRSPYPHAKILHVDTSLAERLTGVRAVITGSDTQGMRVGRFMRDVPPLAEDKVRFVGEKVAAVAADDPDTAEEALNLIEVEYEPLPAVFGPLEAMQPGAPIIHENSPTYDSSSGPVQPQGNIVYHNEWSGGELDRGFRESDLVFEHTFTTPWVHQGYMEPYSCIVAIDDSGQIQVWANNKQPFRLRWQLAGALGVEESQIRVNPCGIGGDFGGKAGAMNVPLAYALAQRSGRPVQMVMSYIEELMAGNPRHPSTITIKTGMKRDGAFWARETRVVYNGGAYGGFRGSLNLSGARQAGGGPYRVPNYKIDSYMVYTNNVPCGSYRAPGEPQAVFAIESHIDMIAREMGIDPYELRLKNVVREGDESGTGQSFNHLRGEETLRRAAEEAGWDSPKRGPNFGRGIAFGQRPQGQAVFIARVGMDETGQATIYSSVPDTGVGFYTVARQVVAEDLGIRRKTLPWPGWIPIRCPSTRAPGRGPASARLTQPLARPRRCGRRLPAWPPSSTVGPKNALYFEAAGSWWKATPKRTSQSESLRPEPSPRPGLRFLASRPPTRKNRRSPPSVPRWRMWRLTRKRVRSPYTG